MIYLLLFFEFFKIGLFTFGGGYAMIPLVKELVLKYDWVTEEEFYNFIGVCESTPGPIAINMATFIGAEQGGFWGSVCATFGVVLPSLIIIILVASILSKFIKNKYVQFFLKGVKPVVVGLILSTGIVLLAKVVGYQSLETFNFNLQSTIIFGILVLLFLLFKYVFKKKINNILLICISAVLGIVVCLIV
jgi:chromate transporter